jgi:hypothetical protein
MSFTQADLKLGGRLVLACDAIGENKLRKAAGIFAEVAGDLNLEAEQGSGLLAPEEDDWSATYPAAVNPAATAQNLQMCARNVHAWGPIYFEGGQARSMCAVCGTVNVAPRGPDDVQATGALQMTIR